MIRTAVGWGSNREEREKKKSQTSWNTIIKLKPYLQLLIMNIT